MASQLLTEREVGRAIDTALADEQWLTYWAILDYQSRGVPLIRCVGHGCEAAIPNVPPFEPWCSPQCQRAVEPRRRLAA